MVEAIEDLRRSREGKVLHHIDHVDYNTFHAKIQYNFVIEIYHYQLVSILVLGQFLWLFLLLLFRIH